MNTKKMFFYMAVLLQIFLTSAVEAADKINTTTVITSNNSIVSTVNTTTLTATITPSTAQGTVSFKTNNNQILGTVAVSNGTANLTTIFPSTGYYLIRAEYNGNDTYNSSTSSNVLISVLTPISLALSSANMATFNLLNDKDTVGYWTFQKGNNIPCGTPEQIRNGKTANGTNALQYSSLILLENAISRVTARNLSENTHYTACFITADSSVSYSQSIITTSGTGVTKNWRAVGNTGFTASTASHTKLDFAQDGTPYAVYVDGDFCISGRMNLLYNNAVSVQRFDGSSWNYVGQCGFSGVPVGKTGAATPLFDHTDATSIAFAPDGTPYVAVSYTQTIIIPSCRVGSCPDPGNPPKRVLAVWRLNGNEWVMVGDYVAYGESPTLVFAPDGKPWIIYTIDGNMIINYFDGTNWTRGTQDLPNKKSDSYSLNFAADGTPYVAYSDGNDGNKLKYTAYVNNAWKTPVTLNSSATDNILLTPDTNGEFYITYRNTDFNYAVTRKLSSPIEQFISSAINLVTAIAPDNSPFMSYQDLSGDNARVIGIENASWVAWDNNGIPAKAAYPAIKFAPNGQLYMIYSDTANGGKASVIKTKINSYTNISVNNSSIYSGINSVISAAATCDLTSLGLVDFPGTIKFKEGSTILGTDTFDIFKNATLNTSGLSVGIHTITAVYEGDNECNGSSASININVRTPSKVNVSISGNGIVTAISSSGISGSPGNIACTSNTGICSAVYESGDLINFLATPAGTTSLFKQWDYYGTSALMPVFIGGTFNIHAVFEEAPRAKNLNTGVSYKTLEAAVSAANSVVPDTLLLLGIPYDGAIILSKGIKMQGGWGLTYEKTNGQWTKLNNGMTIENGNSTLEFFNISSHLLIKKGSLVANGITVE